MPIQQEKPQYTSMEEFLRTHQKETLSRSEIEKVIDRFDVLLKSHIENGEDINEKKPDVLIKGKPLNLNNESLQIGWGGGEPEPIDDAKIDPYLKSPSQERVLRRLKDEYTAVYDKYCELLAERKEIEKNAKLFVEKMINDLHSETDMRALFAHINNSGDYRLAEILHNERIKKTIESNLLRLKIENDQLNNTTTEALPLSPVIDNNASSLTTSLDIVQRPSVDIQTGLSGGPVEPSKNLEAVKKEVPSEQKITITSITDVDADKVFSKDTVAPRANTPNSLTQPVSGLSGDTAFSKDSVSPIKEVPITNATEPIKNVKVENTTEDLIGSDIQTYDDPESPKYNDDEDKSLQSYAENTGLQGKSDYDRIDTMHPLSVADSSIKFGFGATPTLETNTNELASLLHKPSRGDDSKDLLQNTVPPKTTQLVSIDEVSANNGLGTEVITKPSPEKNAKLPEENRSPVSLMKFKPNGETENIIVNVKPEAKPGPVNNEADDFQNRLNELKARVSGNNIENQTTAQKEPLNNTENYKNIFADPTTPMDLSKVTNFFEKDNTPRNDVKEPATVKTEVAAHNSSLSAVKVENTISEQSIAKEAAIAQENTSQVSVKQNAETDNTEQAYAVPVTQPVVQPQERLTEKQVLTPEQRKQSGFGALIRKLTGLSKNPDPNSQQAHEIAQLRANMSKE